MHYLPAGQADRAAYLMFSVSCISTTCYANRNITHGFLSKQPVRGVEEVALAVGPPLYGAPHAKKEACGTGTCSCEPAGGVPFLQP